MIVIFCGVPASGKSTARRELVRELENLNADYGLFVSDDVSAGVYDKVFRFLRKNIREKKILLVDATFYKEKWRKEARKIAEENDEELLVAHLRCSLETSLNRNGAREGDSRVEEKAIHIIHKELERPDNPDLEFDTDRTDPEEVAGVILEKLPVSGSPN